VITITDPAITISGSSSHRVASRGCRSCSLKVARMAVVGIATAGVGARTAAPDERWVEVRSPQFIVRSDAGEKAASRTARQFLMFRAALAELWWWGRVDAATPLLVYAARNEASLRALVPFLPERTGGTLLSLGEQHVVLFRIDLPVPRPDEGSPFQVLYHEYGHFVLDRGFDDLPPWIHEGLAEYLSGSLVEDDEMEIGRPIPSHRRLLRERGLMPVAELLAVSRSSPDLVEQDRTRLFYAESWALVHCLMQSGRGEASRLSRYLVRRRDGAAAEEAARELGDAAALQRELEGYVRGRIPSRGLSLRLPRAEEPSVPRLLDPAEVAAARAQLQRAAARTGLAH
jgi:hypothetical protein